jgi:hypothetical protein
MSAFHHSNVEGRPVNRILHVARYWTPSGRRSAIKHLLIADDKSVMLTAYILIEASTSLAWGLLAKNPNRA